jgi:hypothetical protein
MDAKARKILKKLSGANFAFFVCEKLREKGHKIKDEKIVFFESDFEYVFNNENMTYLIEKFFYESKQFQTHIDVAELVAKHRYIFENELTDLCEAEEEEEDTIKMLVKELAK